MLDLGLATLAWAVGLHGDDDEVDHDAAYVQWCLGLSIHSSHHLNVTTDEESVVADETAAEKWTRVRSSCT